jgi:hypothetical protein
MGGSPVLAYLRPPGRRSFRPAVVDDPERLSTARHVLEARIPQFVPHLLRHDLTRPFRGWIQAPERSVGGEVRQLQEIRLSRVSRDRIVQQALERDVQDAGAELTPGRPRAPRLAGGLANPQVVRELALVVDHEAFGALVERPSLEPLE